MSKKLSGPWRVTFDTNPDDCNLQCIMCERVSNYNKQKKSNEVKRRMPPSLIEDVIEQGVEMGELIEIIPSTMGEPLLYKHFDIFVDLCHKYNLKLNLTTNGTFPRKDIEEWANILVPICSDIKVSWNGYKKETDESIMQGKDHDRAKANLLQLIEVRDELRVKDQDCCTITLQLTFLEMNYLEIPDIVRMAIDYDIDRVKGHHLWVHNIEAEKWSMRRNKDSIRRWNKIALETVKVTENIRKKTGKTIKLENIYPLSEEGKIILENSVCPFLGREAWVSATSVFSPCCAPNELRKQLGDFGLLNKRSLKEIWNSYEYDNLCKNYDNFSLCRSCNMRKEPKEVYKYGLKEN